MKEGWKYVKLGEVATITRGLTYSKNDEAEASNKIVLRSNNVDLSTGKLNFDELKYLKSDFEIPNDKLVREGSLLMCMSNGSKIHLGKVALIDKNYGYAFGGFMALVTPKIEFNPNFFYYSLSSPKYKDFIKQLSAGANINNIKVKDLELFTLPLPPLSEQEEIVRYLDSAFEKIDAMKEKAEEALEEAKALFQSALTEMLTPKEGWKEKKLGEVCEIIGGGTPSKKVPEFYSGNIPWATVGDMNVEKLFQTELYITQEAIKNSSTNIIKQGEIIIATRVGLGKTCILMQDTAINQDLKGIVPKKNNINRKYLFFWFQSIAQYIISNGVGATVQGVKVSFVSNITFPLPPLSEQEEIVRYLDEIHAKVNAIEINTRQTIADCDAMKQAILRNVFE